MTKEEKTEKLYYKFMCFLQENTHRYGSIIGFNSKVKTAKIGILLDFRDQRDFHERLTLESEFIQLIKNIIDED